MSLKQTIDTAIKEAMKAKEADRLRALRAVKSLILLEETKGGTGELTVDDEIKILSRAAKQRRESLEAYKASGREDLAQEEQQDLAVIEEFLPKQLSEAELEAKVAAIIAEVGAAGPQDLGKVMGVASKSLAGQADGRAVSETVKRLLTK